MAEKKDDLARRIKDRNKDPKPKLDMDKIAKRLGASEHFPLDKPFDPANPGATIDEIRRKRGNGKKTKQPK